MGASYGGESARAYNVNVRLSGVQAYVIDCLLESGLYGTTRESVLERLVSGYILEKNTRSGDIEKLVRQARKKGYFSEGKKRK